MNKWILSLFVVVVLGSVAYSQSGQEFSEVPQNAVEQPAGRALQFNQPAGPVKLPAQTATSVTPIPPPPLVFVQSEPMGKAGKITRWEYKLSITSAPLQENELNTLGDDGWELIQVIAKPDLAYHTVFKRPKP